jgi:4-hydroxybenzoate polyprenyltransferase
MKTSLSFFIIVSRPRFWIYSLGPFLIGGAAALSQNEFTQLPWIPLLLFALYFFTFSNLYIYGINDIFDYETDRRNPKKSEYEILVTPERWKILWSAILLTTLPFLIYAFFLGTDALLWFLAFLFFAGEYSAPPIRAKSIPFLDSFMSAGHYVAGGVLGFVLAGGEAISWPLVIAGLLWAMAMHAYSAIPDITADKEAGLSTVATFLKTNGTLMFCTLAYTIATALGARVFGPLFFLLGVPYIFIMYKTYSSRDVFGWYTVFPKLNLLVGFLLFCLTLAFVFGIKFPT